MLIIKVIDDKYACSNVDVIIILSCWRPKNRHESQLITYLTLNVNLLTTSAIDTSRANVVFLNGTSEGIKVLIT